MNVRSGGHEEATAAAIERELQTVRSAIDLVASGASRRVVLAGLHFAQELIRPARRMALGTGTRIVSLWNTDESGGDLAVERWDG
jgi:hypothetical protein